LSPCSGSRSCKPDRRRGRRADVGRIEDRQLSRRKILDQHAGVDDERTAAEVNVAACTVGSSIAITR
jgi:hypothetical protein